MKIPFKIKLWYAKKTHPMKTSTEICDEMQRCHDKSLLYEKAKQVDMVKEMQIRRDTLRWVLMINV